MYKIFVLTLCVGIVMILVSISLICCMNQEKRGYRVQLAGAFVTGAGLSGIVFTLFGVGPAILIGLMCVLYIIINILSNYKRGKNNEKTNRKTICKLCRLVCVLRRMYNAG